MRSRHILISLLLLAGSPALTAQGTKKSASASDVDFPAFVRETQQEPNEAGYAGIVWWIPTRFWELSLERSGFSADAAQQRYQPLQKYTVVAVALGKIGLGNINWISEPEIRENVILRDSEGNIYRPVQKLSGDAEGLVSVIKPVFANILGSMGQNVQLLFFAGTNKMAKPIADPMAQGNFSIVISKLLSDKEDVKEVFEWKLPLTTLSPPKYCPVGKERVQANWKYCPWHGIKLEEPALTNGAAPK